MFECKFQDVTDLAATDDEKLQFKLVNAKIAVLRASGCTFTSDQNINTGS